MFHQLVAIIRSNYVPVIFHCCIPSKLLTYIKEKSIPKYHLRSCQQHLEKIYKLPPDVSCFYHLKTSPFILCLTKNGLLTFIAVITSFRDTFVFLILHPIALTR